MIRWPIFAIPVVLAATGRYQRIEEFTFAFGVALAATTIISALVPAIGVYQQIGLDPGSLKNINPGAYLDQTRDLPPTREGVLRHLDLLGLGGIVTFPSFHAASAVLFAWALWPVKWMRPVALLGNGLGGREIVSARRIGQAIAQRPLSFALPRPMVPAIVPAE